MSRRGNPNRPYYDDLSGRSRGTSQNHYQQPREGYSQQQHHSSQQSSGYWQDEYQSSGNDCRFGNQPPWIPTGQSFNQPWSGHGLGYNQSQQSYWNNSSPNFSSTVRPPGPPATPQNNSFELRTKKWVPPPPPPPPPPMFFDPPVAVNPPPGSKEEREKRLGESRERLMKSLKESKNGATTTKETSDTLTHTAVDTEKSKPEDNRSKSESGSSSNTSQHRRLSLESSSVMPLGTDPSKTNKPTAPSTKRVRSTSCSSSTKKSDNQPPVTRKTQDDTQIQEIKDQVIQQLLSLSQNKLQEIVSNPRSRKFEFVMKYMMKERRCEQAQKERQLAQAGILGTPAENPNCDLVPLDYETLLSDPDLAVNLSNLPPEMIQTLGNIFNLKTEGNDSNDFDSDDYMAVVETGSRDVGNSDAKPDHVPESLEMPDVNKSNLELEADTFFQRDSPGTMFPSETASSTTAVQPSFDSTVTTQSLDFSLRMNLEDVNAENSTSATGFCADSEDMASVFTALEHSAESLTDSLEQIQFQSMTSEENTSAKTLSTGDDQNKSIEFNQPPDHGLSTLPEIESMDVDESFTNAFTKDPSHNVMETNDAIVPTASEVLSTRNKDPVIETPKEDALIESSTEDQTTTAAPGVTTGTLITEEVGLTCSGGSVILPIEAALSELPAKDLFVPSTSTDIAPDDGKSSSNPNPNKNNVITSAELPAVFVVDMKAHNREGRKKSRWDKVDKKQAETVVPTCKDETLPTTEDITEPCQPNVNVASDIEPVIDKANDNKPAVDKANDNEPMTIDNREIDNEAIEIEPKVTYPSNDRSVVAKPSVEPIVNEHAVNEPSKDKDKGNKTQAGVDISSEPAIQSRAMVMIEQSMLDQVNISINENFETLEDPQILSPDKESYEDRSPVNLNSENQFAAEGIVKLEREDNNDHLQRREKRPTLQVGTQTDVLSSSNDLEAMLNQIEHLCQDQALTSAFQQLKHLIGEKPSNVNTSKRSRQTKILPVKSATHTPPSASMTVSTISSSRRLEPISVLDIDAANSMQTMQTMLTEIANKNVPQEKLKLIFKKITEIEKKIETWTEVKKKLYEQVNSILKDEQSASSSHEDNEEDCIPLSSRRAKMQPVATKRPPPRVREMTITIDRIQSSPKPTKSASREPKTIDRPEVRAKPETIESSGDDCKVLPSRSLKKRRTRGPFNSKRKKSSSAAKSRAPATPPVTHKFTPPRPSRSVRDTAVVKCEVVVPRSSTPRHASAPAVPVSGRRSLRSAPEVAVSSPPTARKTKAELKQMVIDPIESDPTPPARRTRTSRAASESISPEELPQTEGRRVTRHQLASESAEEEEPPPQRTRRPGPASKRPQKRSADSETESPDAYSKMKMKACTVVIEPLNQQPAKKPRLTVKTNLFVTEPEETSQDDSNDEGSSSDDDLPLLALSAGSTAKETGEVPIPSAFDMWMRREDGDQASVSSCDTGTTSLEPGDGSTGHKSKKKKSKKSKTRCEEHHSSKHEQLVFTDHQRGAILEIKVCNRQVLAASEEGMVFNYSFKSGKLKKTYSGHTAAITCFCFINNEETDEAERLITGSLDEYSRSFVLKSGEESHPALKVGAAVSIDQKWGTIFVGTKLGEVVKIDAKTFSVVGDHMSFSKEAILALKATKEGPRHVLIVGTRNQAITVRDADTGLLLRSVSGTGQHTVYSLLLHKSLVYCGTMQGTIPVFDFTSGAETFRFIAGNGVRCIKVYYGLLFAGCYDGFIYVFNVHDQRLITKIPGTGKMILCMDIAKNKIIFSCKDSFQVLNFPADVAQALKDAKSK